MCAKNTGQKCFKLHSINAVQPAPLNQYKIYKPDQQDDRSFILLQAEKSTQTLPRGAWWSRKQTWWFTSHRFAVGRPQSLR